MTEKYDLLSVELAWRMQALAAVNERRGEVIGALLEADHSSEQREPLVDEHAQLRAWGDSLQEEMDELTKRRNLAYLEPFEQALEQAINTHEEVRVQASKTRQAANLANAGILDAGKGLDRNARIDAKAAAEVEAVKLRAEAVKADNALNQATHDEMVARAELEAAQEAVKAGLPVSMAE